MKRKLGFILLPFVFLLGVFLAQGATAQASEITNVITKATVNEGKPITVGAWQSIKVDVEFSIPNGGAHEGDTTSVTLPIEFNVATPINFQVTAADGSVIANAKVSSTNPRTLVLTYTDYVDKNSNIAGKFNFNIQIDDNIAKTPGDLAVNLTVNGAVIPAGKVTYKGPDPKTPLNIIKGGWTNGTDPTKSQYKISINQSNKKLTNVVIKDVLGEDGSYVQSSLKITKGTWDSNLNLTNPVDVTSQYINKIIWNGTSFELVVGELDGYGLRLDYSVQRPTVLLWVKNLQIRQLLLRIS